jgi:hypothetical protein
VRANLLNSKLINIYKHYFENIFCLSVHGQATAGEPSLNKSEGTPMNEVSGSGKKNPACAEEEHPAGTAPQPTAASTEQASSGTTASTASRSRLKVRHSALGYIYI